MTETRLLSASFDLPERAPEDPDVFSVFLYFRRDGQKYTESERVDGEYVSVGDGVVRVEDYPVDAYRVNLKAKVSWLEGYLVDDLGDAEYATP